MATLKALFPTWESMWSSYSQNYLQEYYANTLGKKAIHVLMIHSAWHYWKNEDFLNDEESGVDKLMVLIRSKATRLSQNQVLYQNVYEKLKLPTGDFQKLVETTRDDQAPFYRRNTYPASNVTKTGDFQHQGLTYPTQSTERTNKQPQVVIQDGVRRQINQTTFSKQFPIDKNWIARMINSFSEANISIEDAVQELHPIFCDVYPFGEGEMIYDEEIKDYRWKGKRKQEEIEIDPETGKPIEDDESLRDIEKTEYEQMKVDGKEVKATWYLEGTYRKKGREIKELKKLAATSKQKKEQQIESLDKLIKIYEKVYEKPTIKFFFDTLNEAEGFDEYKNIVGNYFVNLLNPAPNSEFRPLSFILVGPPGTGKSFIARKTAEAAGRVFIQIPMNGQAEPTYLKGREIAYGGAEQGKILKEILTKGSCNAVVLIDELTRAGSKSLTDIVGQMTDPDQNSFIFEDDWLKWKIDLSGMVFIIADNHIEKIDPFLLSRSLIVKIPILAYEKRREKVKKDLNKALNSTEETKRYVNMITDEFCKYIIVEEWGLRQTLSNINNLFLGLRAYVLMENPITDFNVIKEAVKDDKAFVLNYENGQRITLVRSLEQERGLDGLIHNVFTDVPDWPRTESDPAPHNEEEERKKITFLDLSNHELRSFNFTLYPELETLDISNNRFTDGYLVDLSTCNKLKYLDASNCGIILRLNFNIRFGDNKKTLEEFHFISAIKTGNFFGGYINLTEFTNLKKISYSWESEKIWLSKELEGKVTRYWPTWEELGEDEKLCYIQNRPHTDYEEIMKNMVVYK